MNKEKTRRFEITCARCGITKEWSQKIYDRHMRLVHDFRNEVKIGDKLGTPLFT